MITLIKGTEAACGTNAAGASTFGSATAVRLVNNGGTARLVTVIMRLEDLQQLELLQCQVTL